MTPPAADHINQQLCDYCSDRSAVLYCRADSAKLCLLCDREVHSTNQLFSKHSRSQLCDRCAASSASIFCETDHSVFCTNCDWENHSQSTLSVHNRRPIEAFTGCPSVTDLLTALGFHDFDTKSLLSCDENATDDDFVGGGGDDDDGFKEFFDWGGYRDFVSLDNLIVPTDASHNYQALDVPPLPKASFSFSF